MIKFVYFDVGGVVVKDFSKTNNWEIVKKEIGITSENNQRFEEIYKNHSTMINTNLDLNDFLKIVQNELDLKPILNYDFLIDGFISRFDKNKSIWPIINEINQNSKIGLLTNMWVGMFCEIESKKMFPSIKWDVIIDSTKVKLEKPDPKIYKLAEDKSGFKGQEILFVENSQGHIDAAKKFGWQTFFYDSSNYQKSSEDLLIFYKSHIPNHDLAGVIP